MDLYDAKLGVGHETAGTLEVILVCNYEADGLQSMLRFGRLLERALRQMNLVVTVIAPVPHFGRLAGGYRYGGWKKWLGHLDKYVVFPRSLHRASQRNDGSRRIAHVVDHGNAMYVPRRRTIPWMVTCHDLLTVRAARGEQTYITPSATGRWLQKWIMQGLTRADHVVCDSAFTRGDWIRLGPSHAETRSSAVTIGLNHPYRLLSRDEVRQRLSVAGLSALEENPFILHVGSNEPRKNRKGVVNVAARLLSHRRCRVVFAGPALSPEILKHAERAGMNGMLVEVIRPSEDLLEALYNQAHVLLFPSFFEGFGWPVAEAQACGCPVICTNTSSVPEVAGDAARLRAPADEEGMAEDVLELFDPTVRARQVALGIANVRRFAPTLMVERYAEQYRRLIFDQRWRD